MAKIISTYKIEKKLKEDAQAKVDAANVNGQNPRFTLSNVCEALVSAWVAGKIKINKK